MRTFCKYAYDFQNAFLLYFLKNQTQNTVLPVSLKFLTTVVLQKVSSSSKPSSNDEQVI
jgi:hypothetical protein